MEIKPRKNAEPNKIVFFPHVFKKIGLSILLGMLALALVYKIFEPSFLYAHKDFIRLHGGNLALLGLFMFAWSKEKLEDEMIHLMKLRAIVLAVYFAVGSTLLEPYLSIFSVDDHMTVRKFLFLLLTMYLMFFYGARYDAKHGT